MTRARVSEVVSFPKCRIAVWDLDSDMLMPLIGINSYTCDQAIAGLKPDLVICCKYMKRFVSADFVHSPMKFWSTVHSA